MLCASGSRENIAEFLRDNRLNIEQSWDKGFSVVVSEAESDDLPLQIENAVVFLRRNKVDLARLAIRDIKVKLDFGIRDAIGDGGFNHIDFLPCQLLRLAGNLSVDIELSHYAVSDE
jgi:hypothetical protein